MTCIPFLLNMVLFIQNAAKGRLVWIVEVLAPVERPRFVIQHLVIVLASLVTMELDVYILLTMVGCILSTEYINTFILYLHFFRNNNIHKVMRSSNKPISHKQTLLFQFTLYNRGFSNTCLISEQCRYRPVRKDVDGYLDLPLSKMHFVCFFS